MNNSVTVAAGSEVFADLERHLLNTVRPKFLSEKELNVFDFFCIVIWKANRAKSKIARNLSNRRNGDLTVAVRDLTRYIFNAQSDEERLRVLIEDWGFRLPMASAILAVLYPDTFTVFDIRVTNVLGQFKYLGERRPFSKLWDEYKKFKDAVALAAPNANTWRERDHRLWGESFARQLREDVEAGFPVRNDA